MYEREIRRMIVRAGRIPAFFRRRNAFPKVEAAGIDLEHVAEEHMLSKNEVGSYHANHSLLAFYDS